MANVGRQSKAGKEAKLVLIDFLTFPQVILIFFPIPSCLQIGWVCHITIVYYVIYR
jgi:hypothetical protein